MGKFDYSGLIEGQKVYFDSEIGMAPMIAKKVHGRFVICIRDFSIEHDFELVEELVKRQVYLTKEEVCVAYKTSQFYSILDFKLMIMGPDNVGECNYNEDDIDKGMRDLLLGNLRVSVKDSVPLKIDWGKTIKLI